VTALGVFALLATPTLFLAPKATLEVAAKTELRRRLPGDQNPDGTRDYQAYDWQLGGLARYALDNRRGKISLAYIPELTYVDFADAQRTTEFSNGFEFESEWRWRRTRVFLSDGLAFGTRGSSSLSVAPLPDPVTGALVVQAVPSASVVHYVANDLTVGVAHTLSRRSDVSVSASYSIAGGSDRASRLVLPLAIGERILGQWQYRVARPDSLVTEASGDTVLTTATNAPTTRTSVAGATERWRHDWSPNTHTELAVGARLAVQSLPATIWYGYPAASASLSQRILTGPEHGVLTLELGAGFDVAIDRLTGFPDRRGQGTATATWKLDRTTVRASGGRAQSLYRDDPNSVTITYGEGGIGYRVLDPLEILGGVRAVDQRYIGATTLPATQRVYQGLQWTTFIGVAWTPTPRVL
jgi:hypothetical protein